MKYSIHREPHALITKGKQLTLSQSRIKRRKNQIKLELILRKYLKSKVQSTAEAIQAHISSVGKAKKKAEVELDWSDLPARTSTVIGAMSKDGATEAFNSVGGKGAEAAIKGPATEWAEKRAAEMVGMKWVEDVLIPNPNAKWTITDSTRELIKNFVADAMDLGSSTNDLADLLMDSFAFSSERAAMIARTEIAMADTAGQLLGYKESGVVSGTQWTTAQDSKVSDECQANEAGGVIPLGEAFPSGATAPPQHPNCRCALVAVLIDDE